MPSAQRSSTQFPVQFDNEFFAGVEADARSSAAIDVDGTIRALTLAMLAEVMKSARATLAVH